MPSLRRRRYGLEEIFEQGSGELTTAATGEIRQHMQEAAVPCQDLDSSDNNSRCYMCYCYPNHLNRLVEVSIPGISEPHRVCQRCYETEDYLILPYHYNPCFKFYSTECDKRTSLYFGIELEIESNGVKKAKIIKSLPEFVYAKRDGSLINGVEIVSHPATYRWIKLNANSWEKILNIRKLGCRSFQTDTCGMHIHLSKAAFGNYQLYKFMKMLYDKNNHKFILDISQRKSVQNLTNWASLKDTEKNIIHKAYHKTYSNESRHTGVNLGRDESVEVRIFRGTLCSASFWKNIEFTKALYDFSYSSSVSNMNEKEFRKYIRFKQKEYPNLHDFLWGEKFDKYVVED